MSVPPQCQHDTEKRCMLFDSGMMTHEESQAAMCMLINPCSLICNMQLNVLNDLAEAMKALEGKKDA